MPIWVSSDHSNRKVFIKYMLADRQSWLLAGVLPNGYYGPRSFCFASECVDQPVMVSLSTWELQVL